MKKQPLLPSKYAAIGYLLFVAAAAAHIFLNQYVSDQTWKIQFPVIMSKEFLGDETYFSLAEVPMYYTVIGASALIGLAIIAFSKVKGEDEYTHSLRLNSWLWSIIINCVLLLICYLFIYGIAFLSVLVYNMYSTLIIFIIRFRYLLYRNKKWLAQ